MSLRSVFHWLTGNREFYQVYADVTSSTPDICLHHHGKIIKEPDDLPQVAECDFSLLKFPVGELDEYKDKRVRMEEVAEDELQRRRLFREGREELRSGNPNEAVEKFSQSCEHDVYLREVEELVQQGEHQNCPQVVEELREIFIHGYKEKFGLRKYERYPEKMREDRKQAGLEKIEKLFSN